MLHPTFLRPTFLRPALGLVLGLLLVLAGFPAAAHGTLPGGGGFVSGALHPFVALDHLLVLLVAGLVLGRDAARWPLLGLAAGLVAGMVAGTGGGFWPGLPPAGIQAGLLMVTIGLGAVLALRVRLPMPVCAALLLAVGVGIGLETDVPPPEWRMAAAGAWVAAMLITLNAFALGSALAPTRAAVALRVAGSWMLAVALMVLALWAGPVQAHETTRSYATLTRDGTGLDATFRVAFRDIEVVVWMDENLDGAVTWAEAAARLPAIAGYLQSSLELQAAGPCTLAQQTAGVSDSGGIAYLDIGFRGECPSAAAPLRATSRLFADVDPDHRLYLTVSDHARQGTAILGRDNPSLELAPEGSSLGAVFQGYLLAGVAHLAGGFDHILFLLMLMLPAVTVQPDTRRAIGQVVSAITGFTLAHALTLTAASTSLLRPPTDLITVLVALSIVITALDNIRPFLPGPRAGVAAFFGLIHGFGFATVLGGSAMAGGVFVTALLGFNLGIELAQIGIVAATMFALLALRGGRPLLWAGSAAGIVAGCYWIATASGLA